MISDTDGNCLFPPGVRAGSEFPNPPPSLVLDADGDVQQMDERE